MHRLQLMPIEHLRLVGSRSQSDAPAHFSGEDAGRVAAAVAAERDSRTPNERTDE